MEAQPVKKVYAAICKVIHELSKVGIKKNNENKIQKYKFRGIDDVYNELSKRISEANLVILPRIVSKTETERKVESKDSYGNAKIIYWKHVSVEVEYDIVSAEDGSIHTVRTTGEGLDNSDKATNKAMSAAYKYMALQTFCIPTEGDNDADSDTPEISVVESGNALMRFGQNPSHTETEPIDAPTHISDAEIYEMVENIHKCQTEDELKNIYAQYYKKAHSCNDQHAILQISIAKDKVKDRLAKEAY